METANIMVYRSLSEYMVVFFFSFPCSFSMLIDDAADNLKNKTKCFCIIDFILRRVASIPFSSFFISYFIVFTWLLVLALRCRIQNK